MKTILIIDQAGVIQSRYQDEAPAQHKYGGPWGDPNQTTHVELPEGILPEAAEAIIVDGEIVIEENVAKKQASLEAKRDARTLAAMAAGKALMEEFILENVKLGITQAGKTRDVRLALREVKDCLETGSLYDAMDEIRAIPEAAKDETFVSDARLLTFLNKIEAILALPLSTEL